jgi:dolichol-phosphate mannosyltransferase
MSGRRRVSVVLPVFNEEDNVRELMRQLTELFAGLPYELEVVLVDDGSDDNTTTILDGLCATYPQAGLIRLSRNFGHQAALTAGLEAARGDAVICMDADLQHPVAAIPRRLEAWEQGCDVVHTIRVSEARGAGVVKRATSAGFYRLLNLVSETRVIPHAADFRLLDRRALDVLNQLPERARFIRGLTVWIGFRQGYVEFQVGARRRGRSKYGLRQMLKLALDGVASMSSLPLKLALVIGSSLSLASGAYLAWVVFAFFFTNRAMHGWSSLIVATLFLGGLQINLIGVLGIYVAKIYDEAKGRPIYIIERQRESHPLDEVAPRRLGLASGPCAESRSPR